MDLPLTTLLAQLRRATDETDRLISNVHCGQWRQPSPCEEMDALGLVHHLVGGLDQFAAVARGGAIDDAVEATFGPEFAEAEYERAATGFVDTWSAPGVGDRSYAMPWGDTPGAMLVGFMLIESVTHGWDLARATGQETRFPDETVALALAVARAADDPSIRVPGMFGPAVGVADAAPLIDQIAGFLGRHP